MVHAHGTLETARCNYDAIVGTTVYESTLLHVIYIERLAQTYCSPTLYIYHVKLCNVTFTFYRSSYLYII